MDSITAFVCTFNSERTILDCMTSLRRALPQSRIVVVDHKSRDRTKEICLRYGAEVFEEDVGLGHARQMCFEMCRTRFLVFVDSDVEGRGPGFFVQGLRELEEEGNGAVVGMALGHRLAYGLPASLLVLRTSDFTGIRIPDAIDARETYFIQRRLGSLGLRTVYLADAMIHRSEYRGMKPEWEGANTRLACGLSGVQLAFALKVILLMSINSRSVKNVAYVPVFYLKFLRGFVDPTSWVRLRRNSS